MRYSTYYRKLKKPFFAPPKWLFGVVWTPLYGIIIMSYMWVFWAFFQGLIPGIVVIPFIANIFFNLIFTWIQFGLRDNFLALLDVLLVVVTLVWALVGIYAYHPVIAYVNIPYLLWGTFATVLQASIWRLNR